MLALTILMPIAASAAFGSGDFVETNSYTGGAGFFGFLRRVGGQAFDASYVPLIEGTVQTEQQNVLVIIAARVINVILSMLGIVLVAFLFYGGFVWLKSRGNTEEIERAQGIIQSAIIGILIVLATFVIAYFVVYSFRSATLQ